MNIVSRERGPNGWNVTIEHPNAYTDGTSRTERVTIPYAKLEGKTPDQVRQAIKDAVDDDPLGPVIGEAVAAPTPTKAILWDRAKAAYADWQMAKTTRVEAQARSMAAAVITALTNAENALWTDYATTLNQWRLAP